MTVNLGEQFGLRLAFRLGLDHDRFLDFDAGSLVAVAFALILRMGFRLGVCVVG